MAAASFLVPSLSGLNSRPNRIRHSVRVNIRRRERITPPPIMIQNRLNSGYQVLYRVFRRLRQAKFADGGSILNSSQFLLLPQLTLKTKLDLKMVKFDSKIIANYDLNQ
jgi:hypothetical protein